MSSSPKYPVNASLTISAARDEFEHALLVFFFFFFGMGFTVVCVFGFEFLAVTSVGYVMED